MCVCVISVMCFSVPEETKPRGVARKKKQRETIDIGNLPPPYIVRTLTRSCTFCHILWQRTGRYSRGAGRSGPEGSAASSISSPDLRAVTPTCPLPPRSRANFFGSPDLTMEEREFRATWSSEQQDRRRTSRDGSKKRKEDK